MHRDRLTAILRPPGDGLLARVPRACSSTPSRPAGHSAAGAGRRRAARHGRSRPMPVRTARTRRSSTASPSCEHGPLLRLDARDDRCSRSSRPRCGTRAKASSSRSVARARHPAGRCCPWDERRRRTEPGVGRHDPARRRRSGPPYDTLNLGLHVGDDPGRAVRQPDPGRGGVRRRRSASMVFARQVHGVGRRRGRARRRAGRGTGIRGRRHPRRRHPRHPIARSHARHPGGRLRPAGARRSRGRASWRPSTPAGGARPPAPSAHALRAMHGRAAPRPAGTRVPRAGRAPGPLPGHRRGAARRCPARCDPASSTPPWRGPTVRATGWSTWSRRTASSWRRAGCRTTTSPTAAPPRPTRRSSATVLQRPCGRFALLARLAG